MSNKNSHHSAGPFDLNRDGKLSMTEHYIAYKAFEQMSQPSSYTPRPRKERWWNKPVDFGYFGNVIYSFFLLIAFQAPFVAGQISFLSSSKRRGNLADTFFINTGIIIAMLPVYTLRLRLWD